MCAGIGAWNYPIQIACWKSAPGARLRQLDGVQAGRADPCSRPRLAEIYTEAGLPDGSFNVVQGDHRVGRGCAAHPGVAKVSLTGEVGTGRIVMAKRRRTLKHVTLELGGKSPLIVFADAHLDNHGLRRAARPTSTPRGRSARTAPGVFVHETVHDEFVASSSTARPRW